MFDTERDGPLSAETFYVREKRRSGASRGWLTRFLMRST
jgi:hypothetical protein